MVDKTGRHGTAAQCGRQGAASCHNKWASYSSEADSWQ
eukprot:COSAG03_NODE_16700_length_394_cov_1.227119_1_plen_37_part_10